MTEILVTRIIDNAIPKYRQTWKMCACTKCKCDLIAAENFPNKQGLCHPCNENMHSSKENEPS